MSNVSQQSKRTKIFVKASVKQRIVSGVVFICILGLFVFLALGALGRIDIGLMAGPCGFKQQYSLPCPSCGITTAALAFMRGDVFGAFYIQPAGALACCILVVGAILTFLTAIFGVKFVFLGRFFAEVRVGYILLVVLIVVVAAWAVTLARAIAKMG